MTSTENMIFRFKFSSDFTEQLIPFAKLHQYDDRHIYKEAWTQWLTCNDDLVDVEVRRLKGLGYGGNILDKMYKSGRYYFRNKTNLENKECKKRRVYISLEHEVIDSMDTHISINYYLPLFKPSIAYGQFCMEYESLIKDETIRLLQEELDKDDIYAKLKKTYKNRYFIFKQNRKDNRKDNRSDNRPDADEYRQDADEYRQEQVIVEHV